MYNNGNSSSKKQLKHCLSNNKEEDISRNRSMYNNNPSSKKQLKHCHYHETE